MSLVCCRLRPLCRGVSRPRSDRERGSLGCQRVTIVYQPAEATEERLAPRRLCSKLSFLLCRVYDSVTCLHVRSVMFTKLRTGKWIGLRLDCHSKLFSLRVNCNIWTANCEGRKTTELLSALTNNITIIWKHQSYYYLVLGPIFISLWCTLLHDYF